MQSIALIDMAVSDYHGGEKAAALKVIRDDGLEFLFPMSHYFNDCCGVSQVEREALELCSGKVLQVGAGTGFHALLLLQAGFEVAVTEISSRACAIMRRRGIERAFNGSFFEFDGGRFDTILFLNRSVGMLGEIERLPDFFRKASAHLNKGGRVLVNSLDFGASPHPMDSAYAQNNRLAGRYPGELRLRFEYKGQRGPDWKWLHLAPADLKTAAARAGWDCGIPYRDAVGDYLMTLEPSNSGVKSASPATILSQY